MKFFLSFTLFFTVTFHCFAQNENILIQFSAVQVENRVQLIFTIKAGNTCNGIQIYHSVDSVNFSEIGDIQGVCGSSDRNETYSFTDNSPAKNKINFYRLQLGTLGYTYITKLFFIQPDGNTALLFPNPVTSETIITFLNTAHDELRLTVFSYDGKMVYESSPSQGNSFRLVKENYSPGLYFYKIYHEGSHKYSGNFTIL
ncbi:MAG: T9SS type A sorting domain-containing protein [Bacteroidetes bacterium]|nr:T9SS type A sorting domain-containing protein [Bacteroidota bacterium]